MTNCELCGEPMPPNETMFRFHGYSGPCPKPSLRGQKAGTAEKEPNLSSPPSAPSSEDAARGVHPEGTPPVMSEAPLAGTPPETPAVRTFKSVEEIWSAYFPTEQAELLAHLEVNGFPCDYERSHSWCHGTMYPNRDGILSCDACGSERRIATVRRFVEQLRARAVHSEQARPQSVSRVHTPAPTEPGLLERLHAADITTRHLRELSAAKQEARRDGGKSRTDHTMVEAIIVWWEGIRHEFIRRPTPAQQVPGLEEKSNGA